jgi:hypothetical protein
MSFVWGNMNQSLQNQPTSLETSQINISSRIMKCELQPLPQNLLCHYDTFFQLCQQDDFAKTLVYPEVSKYYTWNTSRKVFCKRKQGARVPCYDDIRATDALGWVYTIHPNNAECYFLMLLLHAVRGPTSFPSLKTVEGEECQTFREACQKLGLLEIDQNWDTTMSEASL